MVGEVGGEAGGGGVVEAGDALELPEVAAENGARSREAPARGGVEAMSHL